MNLLRKQVKDERVIQMVKRYLKSGVMENGWLYRRIRMCIWKQWKHPRTRKRIGLGMPECVACEGEYSRKAYWRMAGIGVVQRALTKERLINWGFYDLATAYQSLHANY